MTTTPDWQTEHHISLLTGCGIHRDAARKIIGLTDEQLAQAISQFGPVEPKTAKQAALVAAAQAEINFRKEG